MKRLPGPVRPLGPTAGQTAARRWQILSALVALLLLVLAGCLGRKPPETITLTWWITFAVDSPEYPTVEAIAQAYTEGTGNQVELVSVPWDDILPRGTAATRLSITQEGGTGPDVWGPVPHSWTGAFARNGQTLALEESQIQSYNLYDRAAMAACRFEGTQHALPILADAVALLYNKDLVSDPPKRFEELVQVARDLTDAENDRWGLVLPLLSEYHTFPFVDGYGGYVFRCEEEQCNPGDIGLNNEGAARGLQLLSDLYTQERLFPEELADRARMHERATELFVQGQAAMLIEGSTVQEKLAESTVRYGVAAIPPLPDTEAAPRSLTVVQAVFASAHSSHPAEAVELLNHIASQESVIALHEALGRIPVRQDVLRSPELRDDGLLQGWHRQAAGGVALPNLPELDYVWGPWGQALDKGIPGLIPVQEALDQAVEEIAGYLEAD